MKRETIFSPDRIFRYTLWRKVPVTLAFEPRKWAGFVQFIGLNPSTADETKNDPTIRRLIGFASSWGFSEMCMTNLFGFRSTDPDNMKAQAEPIGIANDGWLAAVADQAGLVVCCWGRHGHHRQRAHHVETMLRRRGILLHYFRTLADGTPEHPLYLPKELEPVRWP